MANLLQSKKRTRQMEKRTEINKTRKSRLKTEVRRLHDVMHDGDVSAAHEQYRVVTKLLDQTASKGTVHKKTAARRKSRLARRLNALAAEKPG